MPDRAVPNLPSRDFEATVQFYGRFGFEVTFRDEGWLILRRGTVVLEFFPYPDLDPATSGFMCSIRVADVDELYGAMQAAGIARLTPVVMQPWGQRAGYLIDLDGTQFHLIEDRD